MSDVYMKVRAALDALEEWEDDLRKRAGEQEEDEQSASHAYDEEEAHFTEWAAELLEREERLTVALDWAHAPNPTMDRPMQRLVLRTLLFDVAPHAPYCQIEAAASRMLP
jgi:hypothetical protein